MARQELIPGGYSANETAKRQYFVAGHGYLNEVSANVYANGLSEALTAAASVTTDINAAFAETLAAADAIPAAATLSLTVAEAATSAAGFLNAIFPSSDLVAGGFTLNEAAIRQFFVPGHGYVNDLGRQLIRPPVTMSFAATAAESVTPADSTSGSKALNAAFSDSVFASDTPPGGAGSGGASTSAYGAAIYGAAVYGDSASSSGSGLGYPYIYLGYNSPLAESLIAADATPGGLLFATAILEALASGDALAAGYLLNLTIAEQTALVDLISGELDIPPPLERVYFTDPSARLIQKAAGETWDETLNWALADVIGPGEAIESSDWSVRPAGLGISLPQPSATATTTTVWLSGGRVHELYYVTNTIMTEGGRTFERSFPVYIYH